MIRASKPMRVFNFNDKEIWVFGSAEEHDLYVEYRGDSHRCSVSLSKWDTSPRFFVDMMPPAPEVNSDGSPVSKWFDIKPVVEGMDEAYAIFNLMR